MLLPLNEGRGVKPGDTAGGNSQSSVPGPGYSRSTKAGALAPATLGHQHRAGWPRRTSALNEGRGVSPGDTGLRRKGELWDQGDLRSTKAGALAPATRLRRVPNALGPPPPALNEGRGVSPGDTWSSCASCILTKTAVARSTKAGALAPATLGESYAWASLSCKLVRSTKAGALAPATLPI